MGKAAKDHIYAGRMAAVADFTFNEEVAAVFPDMIQRSVPGYTAILTLIETLAQKHAQPDTRLYDLGCSLGAAALAMRRGCRAPRCRIVAVDSSPAMIQGCRKIIAQDPGDTPVELICEQLENIPVQNASMAVLNFTLQFIAPEDRNEILGRMADGLCENGILVLSEKVCFDDPRLNTLLTEAHHDFKKAHGYSDLEISRKRAALEKVLIPETVDTHRQRLLAAGFQSADVWFQCFNFVSMIAVK
jgi:tRNA (cmo5U34)-methyltransferase